MTNGLKIAAIVPAVVFTAIGVFWLVIPTFAGAQLGMDLLSGAGLSTQIGDMASFFLTVGLCVVLGLKTGNQQWFYPVIMLMLFAAGGRTIAWLVHEAAFAADKIAVELIVAGLLFALARKMKAV